MSIEDFVVDTQTEIMRNTIIYYLRSIGYKSQWNVLQWTKLRYVYISDGGTHATANTYGKPILPTLEFLTRCKHAKLCK